jgi:hypothetical protein
MNGFRDNLPFTDADLDELAAHQRELLERKVTHTTTLALELLGSAGVAPADLPALSERVSRDPDWASGFINRCTVVIRDIEDPNGRLGAWVEDGALCLEASLGARAVLVVRSDGCELHLTSPAGPAGQSAVHDLALAGGMVPLRLGNSGGREVSRAMHPEAPKRNARSGHLEGAGRGSGASHLPAAASVPGSSDRRRKTA